MTSATSTHREARIPSWSLTGIAVPLPDMLCDRTQMPRPRPLIKLALTIRLDLHSLTAGVMRSPLHSETGALPQSP